MTSVNQDINSLKRTYTEMNVGRPINGGSITSPLAAGIAVNGGQAVNSIGISVNGTSMNKSNNNVGSAVNSPNLGTIGVAVGGKTSSQSSNVSTSQLNRRGSQQLQKVHTKYNLRNVKFAETSEEILKKYESFPASLEFHIHENHYRFGSQDGSIPKSNPIIKEFLEHVAREEIPEAIMEVLRDANVRLFEGCLILKIFDHRNTKTVTVTEGTETVVKEVPRTFRTVLKSTPLGLYYDMLSQTDAALQRFTDILGINMEAEVLSATKRNLNLLVPLNLYKGINKSIIPESEFPKITPDGRVIHNHRVECADPRSKAFKPFRELHEDSVPPHESSIYQDLMTVCDPRPSKDTTESHTFNRLRFLEQYRIDREKFKHESLNATKSFSSGLKFGNGSNSSSSFQQQRIQQLQQQQRLNQGIVSNKNSPLQHSITADSSSQGTNTGTPTPGTTQNTGTTTPAEKKPKKKRGPTKKQQAAAAAKAQAEAEALLQQQQITNFPQSGMVPMPGQYGDKTLPGLTPNQGQLDLQQQQQQILMMQQQNGGMINNIPLQVEVQQGGSATKKKRGSYKRKKGETTSGNTTT